MKRDAACDVWFVNRTCWFVGTLFVLVILSAAKNLVLYDGVAPFLVSIDDTGKGATWVLLDEILRCTQNDKGG